MVGFKLLKRNINGWGEDARISNDNVQTVDAVLLFQLFHGLGYISVRCGVDFGQYHFATFSRGKARKAFRLLRCWVADAGDDYGIRTLNIALCQASTNPCAPEETIVSFVFSLDTVSCSPCVAPVIKTTVVFSAL